ncbi:Vacuolar protein-sorting-associated protein 28 [Orbilia oligospora]|uniref:Vacuolar protein sorting-associated protein 28 n=1 Tax=Orbilia oligospora TaxID=2813651 RepID=A0A4Z0Y5V0_ORBOL|nr:Vacuolar protein-sorting-associated protein 28 [Orbilia oligospora]KAF3167610.1 Vacuolar protein-sorting-associated protein 28 [Orbilia oligospora]KAF3178623.1 Vacuolar protein-sorting-associated protein 28 [Orbilia oligospora]KAF3201915.1 Vacuolar protein-sorting-associated protein 28, variant 2 [Orbilia oligospora]KAF3226353.1 Vacuolar protein-sorting-associated protein 28, variant 2 [Orbilia oligospora]
MNNPQYHPAYAPSPSFVPTPSLSSTISLDEEVKLYTTTAQRSLHESLADLFSIIVALDFLEKAFVRDSIKEHEYTPTCFRLLGQYKTILSNDEVSKAFVDLETFKREYDIEYPAATSRLKIGGNIPKNGITAILGQPQPSAGPSAKAVAECTQNFITFMDALSLDFKAKDQLHPLLSELMSSLNNVSNGDFEGRGNLVHWLIKLNGMKATEEMEQEDARQLSFDVDHAYQAFFRTLE